MPTSMLKSGSKAFLFSCRRRHTMSTRDWSSDVCSSDLVPPTLRMVPRLMMLHGQAPLFAITSSLLVVRVPELTKLAPLLRLKDPAQVAVALAVLRDRKSVV